MTPTVALIVLAGTVLTVLGGVVGAWLNSRAATAGSEPDMITAQGGRIDRLWTHVNEQDTKIEAQADKISKLSDEITVLKQQRVRDQDVRHQLKSAVVYVVSVAKQAIAVIEETWPDERIRELPEPLRGHVLGHMTFDDKLDMTRPRRTA